MAIEIPIPSWCRTIRIKESSVVRGEIDVYAVGDVEGSPLLIYGDRTVKFILDTIGKNEAPQPLPIALFCSVCGEPQLETPSGPCCVNGHGGADGLPKEGEVGE